ncbi:hypothetical protein KM043_002375 [Ampulex compressa]|nr:hypothetical protein KM043_002375 [Ampulex compressa]
MGASNGIQTYTFLAVLLLFVRTAYSLNCYQCSSTNNTNPFQCNEFLSSDIDIQPESCDAVFGAQYCVKHVGRFEGGVGTKRFCSAVHKGNYCDYVKQPGDKMTYRTCVFTCSSDGCNPASSLTPTISTWLLPAALIAVHRTLFGR